MAGTTPGPEAERRSLEAGWISIPADAQVVDPPKLSLAGSGVPRAQQKLARELWAYWWASPVATMWDRRSDLEGLRRLVVLTVAGGQAAALLAEVRQLEDRFGLNPVARRKLYWRIEGVDVPSRAASDLGPAAGNGVLPAAGGKKDPRLRVVS